MDPHASFPQPLPAWLMFGVLLPLFLSSCRSELVVVPSEVQTLVDLTNQANAYLFPGWVAPWVCGRIRFGDGEGAFCDEEGHIIKIRMVDQLRSVSKGSIPESISALKRLTHLEFAGRSAVRAFLPASLFKLPRLQVLYLRGSTSGFITSGAIPGAIGDLASLKYLDFSGNELGGSLPGNLGALKALKALNLFGNAIGGSIPDGLSKLKKLQFLNLGRNQLSGSLPSSLGTLAALIALNINGNSIVGSIPGLLSKLKKLKSFDLSYNQLQGSLPSGLGALTALTEFHIYSNSITGSIPRVLWKLKRLQYLNLGFNQLQGSLSKSLGKLTAIEVFDISNNRISGNIPDVFQKLKKLYKLDLSGNRFEGSLPPSLALLGYLLEEGIVGTLPCPKAPCKLRGAQKDGGFCSICTAFCATCPKSLSMSRHGGASGGSQMRVHG